MSRTRTRTAELLAAVPLFKRCSDKELDALSKLCTQTDFVVSEALTREGSVGHEFFILLSGTADVQTGGTTVATLGAGDHVGELSLLARAPRSATVVATTPVSAMVLSAQEFWEAIRSSPGLDQSLLASLAHQLLESRAHKHA